MFYLDSSAIVKLVREEQSSQALRDFLLSRSELVSSAIARVEVLRAAARQEPSPMDRAIFVLARTRFITIDKGILDAAARLGPPTLRTLDAIHLASALALDDALESVVTYDARMAAAAASLGIEVSAPA